MFVIEKLNDVPLGAVLLKHLFNCICCPELVQPKTEFKNVPVDFGVHT